ncbi:MAG: adenine deaminase [Nitrospinota bacterium]
MREAGTHTQREELIKVSMGEDSADLAIVNGRVVNVMSGEVHEADLLIKGGRIAYLGKGENLRERAAEIIDATGLFLTPGLMDGHVHNESSMMTVTRYAQAVLPHGTTAVFIDPHQTVHAVGIEGIRLAVEEGRQTPLRAFVNISSCLPEATYGDKAGNSEAMLQEVRGMLKWDRIVGVGEVYDKWGLVRRNPRLLAEVDASLACEKAVDGGNAAGLFLNPYAAAGVQSDHETRDVEGAVERLRLGMTLMIRDSSVARNLADILPVLTQRGLNSHQCCFATDDKTPTDLAGEGHIDWMVRRSIQSGLSPMQAVQMATINCARHFRLDRDLGSLSPGRLADVVFVRDLAEFEVARVMVGGELIAENGELTVSLPDYRYPPHLMDVLSFSRKFTASDFAIPSRRGEKSQVWAIEVGDDHILGLKVKEELRVVSGHIQPTPQKDVVKLVVMEPGKLPGDPPAIGRGFAKGFGMRSGAFGCSVSRDKLQTVVAGVDDEDIALAANRLAELHGGLVVVNQGRILGGCPLPVCSVLSPAPAEEFIRTMRGLHETLKRTAGCRLNNPFMTLGLSTSPGIPVLKLTTQGLYDYDKQGCIELEAA